jgi:hypothetical protein
MKPHIYVKSHGRLATSPKRGHSFFFSNPLAEDDFIPSFMTSSGHAAYMLPWSPAGRTGGLDSSLVHACFLFLAIESITVSLSCGPALTGSSSLPNLP